MLVGVNVSELHVVLKTRVFETKLRGNAIPIESICLEVYVELFLVYLSQRDSWKLNSSVARMHVAMASRVTV